ncbi:dihydrofolate synthetase [Tanacetum coccineum]
MYTSSTQAVNSFFQRIKDVLDKAVQLEMVQLSHFEVLTAVAFNLFAEENVDISVIEAGLGGARDATNILSSVDLENTFWSKHNQTHCIFNKSVALNSLTQATK